MNKIILDTSIILRNAGVFSTKMDDGVFVIPSLIKQELLTRTKYFKNSLESPFSIIINHAVEKGIFEIATLDYNFNTSFFPYARFSVADLHILQLAKNLIDNGLDHVSIATLDEDIIQKATKLGIHIYSEDELRALIESYASKSNIAIQVEVKEAKIQSFYRRFLMFFIAAIIAILLLVAYYNIVSLFDWLGVYWSWFLIVIFSVIMFFCKLKYLSYYAAVEFFIGALSILLILLDKDTIKSIGTDISVPLKIVAGLYVCVRGLDNLYKAFDYLQLFHDSKKRSLWSLLVKENIIITYLQSKLNFNDWVLVKYVRRGK